MDKVLYKGWLRVVSREHNGRNYEVIDMPGAVAGLICDPNLGKVLLVKQERPAIHGEDKWTWEIPAGMQDVAGETPEQCLSREIKEETGIEAEIGDLITSYYPVIGCSNHVIKLYQCLADSMIPLPKLNDNDVVKAQWFSIDEFFQMVDNGEIKDGKTVLVSYIV